MDTGFERAVERTIEQLEELELAVRMCARWGAIHVVENTKNEPYGLVKVSWVRFECRYAPDGRFWTGDIVRAVTSDQCRAARALLRWTVNELASRSGVGRTAIQMFENERRNPHRATVRALRTTFEEAGVEFLDNGDGPGLRLKQRPKP